MIRNTFTAECARCHEERPGCATCSVLGTNAWGDRERRTVSMCGECRRSMSGRVILHPKHKAPVKA